MTAQLSMPRTSPRHTLQLRPAPLTRAPATTSEPRFGRMFEHLPAFAEDSPSLRDALLAIGAPGGPMDAGNVGASRKNPNVPAGMIFFGQFAERDLRVDTPRFALESVYGLGPSAQPELYGGTQRTKLRLESDGRFDDLPRRADHAAIFAGRPEDADLVVSALHAAFGMFHNHAVGVLSAPSRDPMKVFAAARKLTTWHYQWLVVNRVLPSFVGADLVENILQRGTRFFAPYDRPYLPAEFACAVARFGYSTVRPFCAQRLGWQQFFDFGGGYAADVQRSKMIDTSSPALPPGAAQRILLRQLTSALPSGQRVAREMGVVPLSRGDLADLGAYGHDLATSTPLWLYVLREADLFNGGEFLGPVGGRILAEVAIGLLRADPDSYLFSRPSWQPVLGVRPGAEYEIADFLRFARVDPCSRRQ